mmetsp:Transcript_8708/g.17209  ORF Transcript_8708/g.17209 Transcript_8708/m.17209 type:complete len:232 (-) Transcript_8708:42-737(-)
MEPLFLSCFELGFLGDEGPAGVMSIKTSAAPSDSRPSSALASSLAGRLPNSTGDHAFLLSNRCWRTSARKSSERSLSTSLLFSGLRKPIRPVSSAATSRLPCALVKFRGSCPPCEEALLELRLAGVAVGCREGCFRFKRYLFTTGTPAPDAGAAAQAWSYFARRSLSYSVSNASMTLRKSSLQPPLSGCTSSTRLLKAARRPSWSTEGSTWSTSYNDSMAAGATPALPLSR